MWKCVLWSDGFTFWLVFLEKRRLDSTCQRWQIPSRHCQQKVQKTASVIVWGCISAHCRWSAYMWRYHWYRGSCWNFGETYAAIKSFPRNCCLSDNSDNGMLSSSSLVYTKNGQKCNLQNCNIWYLQFQNKNVIKSKCDVTPWETVCLSQLFFWVCCRHSFLNLFKSNEVNQWKPWKSCICPFVKLQMTDFSF